MERLYEKYVDRNFFDFKNASKFNKLEELEESISALIISNFMALFLLFTVFAGHLIWGNKLTLFILAIATPIAVGFVVILFKYINTWKKLLLEIINDIRYRTGKAPVKLLKEHLNDREESDV